MDDFYVPCKHNFHPNDIISDIELLGGKVYHFDNDFRDYCHDGHEYFSVGGDRIYITKDKKTDVNFLGISDNLNDFKELSMVWYATQNVCATKLRTYRSKLAPPGRDRQ